MTENKSESTGAAKSAAPAPSERTLLESIDALSRWVVIVMLAIMTTTVATQVFFRYALNDSIDWADEVSRLTFVWVVFLALPHGLKVGAHVGIDLLVRLIPAHIQTIVFRFTSVIAAALMLMVAAQATLTAHQTWDQPLATINAPAALFYVAVIIGAVHSVLHLMAFAFGRPPPDMGADDPEPVDDADETLETPETGDLDAPVGGRTTALREDNRS